MGELAPAEGLAREGLAPAERHTTLQKNDWYTRSAVYICMQPCKADRHVCPHSRTLGARVYMV